MTPQELDMVFGPDSVGNTPQVRAATSQFVFVRSQTQLARHTPAATGRQFTASEALRNHGIRALEEVNWEGSFVIVEHRGEPTSSFLRRRTALGLGIGDVAQATGLSHEIVERAETAGGMSKIRDLGIIAQTLGMNEISIGRDMDADILPQARLAKAAGSGAFRTGPELVVGLSQASWIVARQVALSYLVGASTQAWKSVLLPRYHDLEAHDHGRDTAYLVRSMAGLPADEPLESLETVIQDVLDIPIVRMDLPRHVVSAILAVRDDKGIVLNPDSRSDDGFARRMLLARELGRFLCCPLDHLRPIAVSAGSATLEHVDGNDWVERCARAFAVNLLAPAGAVADIMSGSATPLDGMSTLMARYGIDEESAHGHILRVTGIDVHGHPDVDDARWIADDCVGTSSLVLEGVPASRQGRFSWLTMRACSGRLISSDTAASFLGINVQRVEECLASMPEWDPVEAAMAAEAACGSGSPHGHEPSPPRQVC